MEIKIEATPEELYEIHQLLYQNDKDVDVDEEYGPTEGFQMEPLVIALIVALTPVTMAVINGYFKTRQVEIKAKYEQLKIEKKAENEFAKLYLKEGKKWKNISINEFDDLKKTQNKKLMTQKKGS